MSDLNAQTQSAANQANPIPMAIKPPPPSLMPWPDFSMYGMRLVCVKIPNGQMRLMMMGGDKSPSRLRALGFSNASGLWLRKETKIGLPFIKTMFSQVKAHAIPPHDVYRIMRPISQDANVEVSREVAQEVAQEVAAMTANPIGINLLDEQVYQGAEGRFVRSNDGVIENMDEKSSGGRYLRAATDEDLQYCMDALVRRIVNGEVIRDEVMAKYAEHIFDVSSDNIEPFMDGFHEALNSSLMRRMIEDTSDSGRNAFNLALKLHEGLPPLTESFAESIVPMPIGVVMQRLSSLSEGTSRIYAPSVGNGAMLTGLPEGSVIITHNNPEDVRRNVRPGIDVEQSESIPVHNMWISNLTYGELSKPVSVMGYQISRSDHLEVVQSLQKRGSNGRSVFMLKATGETGEPDLETRRLLQWISAKYNIEAAVEMDGSLFGTGSAAANRYMITVGDAGQSSNINFDKVHTVYDYDSLWSWADNFVEERQRLAEESSILIENSYQSPYISASQIGKPTSMIPRNLVGPVREALSKLEKQFGQIDDFVADQLQHTKEELGQYYSPEQIDAIGLNIAAHKNGRGFINADQTGLGKGRCMAAIARYAILNDKKVIFMTEKDNLLSDFWRDTINTGNAELFKPHIFNTGVPIIVDGKRVINSTKSEAAKAVVANQELPHGCNIMLATYAHFNRDNRKNNEAKSECLKAIAQDAYIVMDEAHNAAGESNVNFNMLRAIKNCSGITYSSATFAKDSNNFRIYTSVMPPSVSPHSIPDVLRKGGDPLAEVFSAMLAEDAVMIRREHDLSNIRFETSEDKANLERNEMLANRFAEILEGMGLLMGDIGQIINERNNLINQEFAKQAEIHNKAIEASGIKNWKEKLIKAKVAGRKEMGWFTSNFGSAFYAVLRQFMLAIKSDHSADLAIKALQEGRKPIIVIEQTNEALIRAAIQRSRQVRDSIEYDPYADLEEVLEGLSDTPEVEEETLLNPVTFRDVLHNLLERISVVYSVQNNVKLADETVENEDITRFRAALSAKIDAFPDLHISPIDLMRTRIEDAGYTCGELSGRKVGVINRPDGSQVVKPVKIGNRNKAIYNFNSGMLDCMILTTAGASGISMHAGMHFADQRQREMIEAQISNNVATRVQLLGRVNRLDQVCYPIYRSASTGLPAETRLLSMQNAKLREMSANTTSNRDSTLLDDENIDILNKVGDVVCLTFLRENPGIAKRLMVDEDKLVKDAEKKVVPLFYANQLTGRIGMLPVDEQRSVYAMVNETYREEIRRLDELGENPLKSTELDWKATKVPKDIVFDPIIKTGSVFDQPTTYTRLDYVRYINPTPLAEIYETIKKYQEKNFGKDDPSTLMAKYAKRGLDSVLADKNFSKSVYKTYEEAIADPDSNASRMLLRMEKLQKYAKDLVPGKGFMYSGWDEVVRQGIIVRVDPPEFGKETLLGQYSFEVYVPNYGSTQMSLYTRMSDFEEDTFSFFDNTENVREEIINQKAGEVKEYRYVLDGNLFTAAEYAADKRQGNSVVYTNETNERQRAILLPYEHEYPYMDEDYAVNQDIANVLMHKSLNNYAEDTVLSFLTTKKGATKKGLFISFDLPKNGRKCVVTIPNTKDSVQFIDRSLVPEIANQQFRMIRGERESYKHVKLELDHIPQLLQEIYDNNMTIFVANSRREEVLAIYEEIQERKRLEAKNEQSSGKALKMS